MILDSKTGKKFVGFYRGQVMSHLGNGACKIWIPGVYPEAWCETDSQGGMLDAYNQPLRGAKLPTASAAFPPFGGTMDEGLFAMPAINSFVWCFFENDDSNFPVYFANASSSINMHTMNDMTSSTNPQPIGKSAAEGTPRLKRDVKFQFGGAYILFSPNKKIEIGFDSDLTNPNAIDEAKSKSENSGRKNPSIILDANGEITISSGSKVTINSTGDAGVIVNCPGSGGQTIEVNRRGIDLYSGSGGITMLGNNSVTINSNRLVDIQNHKAMYNNLTGSNGGD